MWSKTSLVFRPQKDKVYSRSKDLIVSKIDWIHPLGLWSEWRCEEFEEHKSTDGDNLLKKQILSEYKQLPINWQLFQNKVTR